MKFIYASQDMTDLKNAQRNCWLLTNGLGGYMSTTSAFGVNRCDHGILVEAESAPNKRNMLVHRIQEKLKLGNDEIYLSTQEFSDATPAENGYRHMTSFVVDDCLPEWTYFYKGIQVIRRCCMEYEKNTSLIIYEITNMGDKEAVFSAIPFITCKPKGQTLKVNKSSPIPVLSQLRPFRADKTEPACMEMTTCKLIFEGHQIQIASNGHIDSFPPVCQHLYYSFDVRDGRTACGDTWGTVRLQASIPAGAKSNLFICFTSEDTFPDYLPEHAEDGFTAFRRRQKSLLSKAAFTDPLARQLVLSADAYLSRKDSTGGKTLLAGYPFFGDWGRDTMISLPGCILETGQYEAAKEILSTFLTYEKDGLLPNLFPDGDEKPMYNSVDAPLLLINALYLYEKATGDASLIRSHWARLVNILEKYEHGTHYGIYMDKDGLIHAGEGLMQLTWMDVCVDGFLPTPRHGKPVEINAYWYNALRIMAEWAQREEVLSGINKQKLSRHWHQLADLVRDSFRESFWIPDKGYLRDVISDKDTGWESASSADEQIRCNQIWTITLPYTMLTREQEKQIVSVVGQHLFTPCGLRTLTPEDADFHPSYGGSLYARDTAYHQGTVWPYPLGAYYLAFLKTRKYSQAAVRQVRHSMLSMEALLREGCVGQIAEIYDGLYPGESRGCFAQAWSAGELLRVYRVLETWEAQYEIQ